MSFRTRPVGLAPVPWAQAFSELGVSGHAEVEFTGVTGDSRAVQPQDLYCALPGENFHGARFVAGAVASGAVAVLTDAEGAAQLSDCAVPVAVVDDPRSAVAVVAARIYHHPTKDLKMLGVTGTNGKTTTTYLMDAALRHLGHTTGLVGTVQTRVGTEAMASVRTTPESYDLQALFAVMVQAGVTHCGIEVSSHALALHRVGGICFDAVGFTNLSQDHLDFHGSMAEYFATKADLFTPARARTGFVWAGDEWATQLVSRASVPVQMLGTDAEHAQWLVSQVDTQALGSDYVLRVAGQDHAVRCPLPGDFNVANTTLAIAMLAAVGVPLADAIRGVGACLGVPGRMERVSAMHGSPLALVDFAHTPDAVSAACQTVRPVTRGKLVVVIGAGGDRDPGKRHGMGQAAAECADVVVVTDDNPRSEDPALIRAAVLAGARSGTSEVVEVAGRALAIDHAVSLLAGPDDTVLVVGKGHEQGQEVEGVKTPFDDRVQTATSLVKNGFEAVSDYR